MKLLLVIIVIYALYILYDKYLGLHFLLDDFLTKEEKVKRIKYILKYRLIRYGNWFNDDEIFLNEDLDDYLDSLSEIELFGLPEGTIITILDNAWELINKGYKSPELYHKIDELRVSVGFPKGRIIENPKIATYIIYRLRLEEPLLWSEENIQDDIINELVDSSLKEFYFPSIGLSNWD